MPNHPQNLFKAHVFSPYPTKYESANAQGYKTEYKVTTSEDRLRFCEQYYARNVQMEIDREALRTATKK